MSFAEKISEASTCASGRKVGCIIVRESKILSTGCNGYPIGYPVSDTCDRRVAGIESGHSLSSCVCVHAEANCIALAAKYGVYLDSGEIYCTTEPCTSCIGLIANSGISSVIYRHCYANTKFREISKYAEIRVEKI